ncbi:hypothetical protein DV515_00010259 [Chloebia gouldiae]|uniref:Uncharacterized protein n=1 Tax=Chloebia gouldiae TaxID=44316 RepID=A0A3L8SAV7_CHLGU|nr:hypothetical protein DV515_00010259 [Chloebia gouldiae]
MQSLQEQNYLMVAKIGEIPNCSGTLKRAIAVVLCPVPYLLADLQLLMRLRIAPVKYGFLISYTNTEVANTMAKRWSSAMGNKHNCVNNLLSSGLGYRQLQLVCRDQLARPLLLSKCQSSAAAIQGNRKEKEEKIDCLYVEEMSLCLEVMELPTSSSQSTVAPIANICQRRASRATRYGSSQFNDSSTLLHPGAVCLVSHIMEPKLVRGFMLALIYGFYELKKIILNSDALKTALSMAIGIKRRNFYGTQTVTTL